MWFQFIVVVLCWLLVKIKRVIGRRGGIEHGIDLDLVRVFGWLGVSRLLQPHAAETSGDLDTRVDPEFMGHLAGRAGVLLFESEPAGRSGGVLRVGVERLQCLRDGIRGSAAALRDGLVVDDDLHGGEIGRRAGVKPASPVYLSGALPIELSVMLSYTWLTKGPAVTMSGGIVSCKMFSSPETLSFKSVQLVHN